MMPSLERWGQRFHHRISMMIGRAILRRADDTGGVQLHQLEMLDGELLDDVEHRQPYGFTSNVKPSDTTEALLLAVGGQRGNGVVVLVGDPALRLKDLQPGEVAMHDDQGQKVVILRDKILVTTTKDVEVDARNVTLTASGDVTGTISGGLTLTVTGTAQITAAHAQLISDDVQLGAAGGKKVALDGDSVVAGKVVASSTKVKAT